jgi:hypothetical protein
VLVPSSREDKSSTTIKGRKCRVIEEINRITNIMDSKLTELIKFFEDIDNVTIDKGVFGKRLGPDETKFFPCYLDALDPGISKLVSDRTIDTSCWLCDAGAGDYRVVALTTGKYKIPTIGIEYNPILVEVGKDCISKLKQKSIIEKIPIIIAQGDFTKDDVYNKYGIPFEDIKTFFNFKTNQEGIANKIARQSPTGTVFLFYTTVKEAQKFNGLNFERTLNLPYPQFPDTYTYLHVYQK